MHTWLIDGLECSSYHGGLDWEVTERDGDRIEEAMATCRACDVDYPVRQGIGLFLTLDLLHMRQLVELEWAYLLRRVEPYGVRYAGEW